MKYMIFCLMMVCTAACGRSDDSPTVAQSDAQSVADQGVAEAQEIVERAKKVEPLGATEGTEGCDVFDSGLVEDYFQPGGAEVVYTSSIPVRRARHVVCFARRDKPNKEQRAKDNQQAMMGWGKARASGDKQPMPKLASDSNEVSLTLVANSFNSADDAVASLEETVAMLSEGISFKVESKQHETKMEFGPWIEGVGDKAIWSDKSGLNFAYDAKRYVVNVSVYGDEAENREAAIGLAQRLIETL